MILDSIDNLDLVYSPDDGGYYWQDYKNDRVSFIYLYEIQARQAYRNDQIIWN